MGLASSYLPQISRRVRSSACGLTVHSSRTCPLARPSRLNSGVRRVVSHSRQIEIWNRAATESGGTNPAPGDCALAAILLAHGAVMNGGVAHAHEVLSPEELAAAISGFNYFAIPAAAHVLALPSPDTENASEMADHAYWRAVPSDAALTHAFRIKLLSHPEAFAPTVGGAHA